MTVRVSNAFYKSFKAALPLEICFLTIKKQITCEEAYSEPCQTSKMNYFAKIVNGFQPLTNIAKLSILDVFSVMNMLFKFLKQPNILRNLYEIISTIIHKISETNSSFHVK